ncbi:NADH:ubiquinone oxidoreductase subunit C [Desulfonema ishimotonii]|uniref:Na(+)-translocating NADH-quinone reductase subunit C n=1 Tax=Desulfonema ishimotonii TaxID=45657 RepID=A0A401G2C6_9BACT|nr:NADH:ubiquinone reductase (Na(+)-transporting) subunit C [Desulfonema ishimotonii]GBC63374.1 NADH:ubiquinone oxidoreductase subunit C [Desulfonema ishimotonii]
MSGNVRSLVFAGVMCLVCSLLLTAASSGLKPFQDRNVLIDKNKNILKSVGLIADGVTYSGPEIEKLYAANIRHVWIDAAGDIVPAARKQPGDLSMYLWLRGDAIASYIIPIESRGLWGKIYGYLALKNDGATISGFTVYQHNETPGLGGEIEKAWFQKNFQGKKIVGQDGEFVSVGIAKGAMAEAEKAHYVDGISGATLTGKFLTGGLRKTLREYEPISIRFRKNQMKRVPDGG